MTANPITAPAGDEVLTPAQAAQVLKRGRRNIYTLQKQGILPRVVLPGRKRGGGIPASAVYSLLASCTVKGGQP